MASTPQRKALTLHEKQKVIDIIEKAEQGGKKPNYAEIAKQFGSHRSTISVISKKRDTLKDRAKADTQSPSSKRFRPFKHDDVDEALYLWVKQKLDQDARLNLPLLKAKAVMPIKKEKKKTHTNLPMSNVLTSPYLSQVLPTVSRLPRPSLSCQSA